MQRLLVTRSLQGPQGSTLGYIEETNVLSVLAQLGGGCASSGRAGARVEVRNATRCASTFAVESVEKLGRTSFATSKKHFAEWTNLIRQDAGLGITKRRELGCRIIIQTKRSCITVTLRCQIDHTQPTAACLAYRDPRPRSESGRCPGYVRCDWYGSSGLYHC